MSNENIKEILHKYTKECDNCKCKCSISCELYSAKQIKDEILELFVKEFKEQ